MIQVVSHWLRRIGFANATRIRYKKRRSKQANGRNYARAILKAAFFFSFSFLLFRGVPNTTTFLVPKSGAQFELCFFFELYLRTKQKQKQKARRVKNFMKQKNSFYKLFVRVLALLFVACRDWKNISRIL